ncbi:pirin family protein [Microbacterium schleiferi]|uniref:Pirin family protein n=1 Tax=Microbacterium schleiferi TaxID=69362 RepID=A0A7S8RGT2_9MICO|nr:pirin family protein [Microbacterium schleiferi]QPE04736.1 pirin family protein [Microbacterium schleiferi]
MTRLDSDAAVAQEGAADCDGPRLLTLEAREVPLGGVRGMHVSRALPQRDLPMVGAWCFLDRFGPQRTTMRVDPHPHIGLQTVTWPISGEVRHRDSVGSDVIVRRGVLNLMTAGAGISHSEYSVGDADVDLDALQLWVALPEATRFGEASFERHADLPVLDLPAASGSAQATVVLGTLGEASSPATAHTPIVGAELELTPDADVLVPLETGWEHALLLIDGDATVNGAPGAATDDTAALDANSLLYLGTHRDAITLRSTTGARVFLLGGEPFPDEIVMWWNFVGRSHDEIVAARQDWENAAARFGQVVDHGPERIPAPPLPGVRLTRRRRRL